MRRRHYPEICPALCLAANTLKNLINCTRFSKNNRFCSCFFVVVVRHGPVCMLYRFCALVGFFYFFDFGVHVFAAGEFCADLFSNKQLIIVFILVLKLRRCELAWSARLQT